MSGPINRFPEGFLNFLNLKVGGSVVNETADDLRLTLDMTPFYRLGTREEVSNVQALTSAPGDTVAITVPSNEYWIVRHIGVTVTGAGFVFAGTQFVGLERFNVVTPIMSSYTYAAVAAGETRAVTQEKNDLLILRPGDVVRATTWAVSGQHTRGLSVFASRFDF